jgi:hypothetical protein
MPAAADRCRPPWARQRRRCRRCQPLSRAQGHHSGRQLLGHMGHPAHSGMKGDVKIPRDIENQESPSWSTLVDIGPHGFPSSVQRPGSSVPHHSGRGGSNDFGNLYAPPSTTVDRCRPLSTAVVALFSAATLDGSLDGPRTEQSRARHARQGTARLGALLGRTPGLWCESHCDAGTVGALGQCC